MSSLQGEGVAPGMWREASRAESRGRAAVARLAAAWDRIALGAAVLLSLALGLYRIGLEGTANAYYAAAVKSMLQSWHAFFFNSFDSAGFVTVDKPPAGLWLQTASAAIFGFHGWSILLPQILAAAGSVLVLGLLVRRTWGPVAGVLAALALAVAPINVAVSRNNSSDAVLAFVMLLAAWATVRALDDARGVRWFCLAMALIGVGFNIKMLEAYLVLPAFVAAWMLADGRRELPDGFLASARRSLRARLGGLVAGGLTLVAVSFSWATVVALVPADERPYIGSSDDNSVFNLIFGYNGINRLLPKGWSILGITNGSSPSGAGAGGGVGGVSENGATGVFRLLNANLGGQIGWLIPFAVVGLVAAWGWPLRLRFDRERLSLVIWGGWFGTMAAFFSVAGFYHRYYLAVLSPAVAALFGIGAVAMWRTHRAGSWSGLLLPAAIGLTAWSQLRILAGYPAWHDRLAPAITVVAIAAAAGLTVAWVALRFERGGRLISPRVARGLATVAVLAMLIAPAAWSGVTVTRAGNAALPVAGPSSSVVDIGGPGGMNRGTASADIPAGAAPGSDDGAGRAMPGGMGEVSSGLIAYLLANKGDATWIVAVQSANQGAGIILQTGEAVMAMGGFSGSDQILTAESFAQYVANGAVRFVLAGGGGGGAMPGDGAGNQNDGGARPAPGSAGAPATGDDGGQGGAGAGPNANNDVQQWVTANCTPVDASAYGAMSSGGASLYDCQGAA